MNPPSIPERKLTQYDFIFFLTGLQKERLLRSQNFAVLSLGDDLRKYLSRTVDSSLREFLKAPEVFAGWVRNSAQDDQEALRKAARTMAGITDGYSLLIDSNPPKVCSRLLMRVGASPDASLKSYAAEGTWIAWGNVAPEISARWEQAKSSFADCLPPFFICACAAELNASSELQRQLFYSARMFREGAQSSSYGISYLLKFSALEGLVCGPELRNKQKLLSGRLGTLFRKAGLMAPGDVAKLWALRCSASHQAKAFDLDEDPNATLHAPYIETIDRLFRGALLFALENLQSAETVEQLWSKAACYDLPAFAAEGRPPSMHRVAAAHFVLDSNILIAGIGAVVDELSLTLQKEFGPSGEIADRQGHK